MGRGSAVLKSGLSGRGFLEVGMISEFEAERRPIPAGNKIFPARSSDRSMRGKLPERI
jgi:hypothetical protein